MSLQSLLIEFNEFLVE